MAKPYILLSGVLLFCLSGVPFLSHTAEVHSSDLMSLGCDLEGQMLLDGEKKATCKDLNLNNIKGSLEVERISKLPEDKEDAQSEADGGTDANIESPYLYKITSTIDCEVCQSGTQATRIVKDIESLRKISDELFAEQTELAAKEILDQEKRQRELDLCVVKADGTVIQRQSDVLNCRLGKLSAMPDGTEEEREAAADYYNSNIKNQLQALLQSNDELTRKRAISITEKFAKATQLNCEQTNASLSVGLQHMSKSLCDLKAYGQYTLQVDSLSEAANRPGLNNEAAAARLEELQSTWGAYYQERFKTHVASPVNTYKIGDSLSEDLKQNNAAFNKNLDAIVARHADLLNTSQVAQADLGMTLQLKAASDAKAAAAIVNGRIKRGAIITGDVVPAGSIMKPVTVPPNWKYTGAPREGTPVGQ